MVLADLRDPTKRREELEASWCPSEDSSPVKVPRPRHSRSATASRSADIVFLSSLSLERHRGALPNERDHKHR